MAAMDFGSDFGQRVDLTVRIREILRNYPEGTSILKELVQNADDAGARRFSVCLDLRRHGAVSCVDARLEEFQGAALLVFNDATFTETDFRSIQQLGDSLKGGDASGRGKTGRFGIGFNSVFHLTDLPSFATADRVVFFDPQAKFLPGVDPTNPGKMLDVFRDAALFEKCADQFAGLEGAYGWKRGPRRFEGTLFRLSLRTEAQASTSRLSTKAHSPEAMRSLLDDFAAQATEMLLFLKSLESIEVCVWHAGETEMTVLDTASLDAGDAALRDLRALRGGTKALPKSGECDYEMFIARTTTPQSTGEAPVRRSERWLVCNQLGGGRASVLAHDAANAHLKLVPWAGVAARVSDEELRGRAYCFLPLPVLTLLPVHVNGFFELSSNRRDVWHGDADSSGDGAARAKWNEALAVDVAGPCYARALCGAKACFAAGSPRYEKLWPDADFFATSAHPLWRGFAEAALQAMRSSDLPSLPTSVGTWVACKHAILLPPDASRAASKRAASLLPHDDLEARAITSALAVVNLAVVGASATGFLAPALRAVLAPADLCAHGHGVAAHHATAAFLVRTLAAAGPKVLPALAKQVDRLALLSLLRYVVRSSSDLHGAPLIPLADGAIAKFARAPAVQRDHAISQMGFGELSVRAHVAHCGGDADKALALLVSSDAAADVSPFYFLCDDSQLELFAAKPCRVVRKSDFEDDDLRRFAAGAEHVWNLVLLRPRYAAELVKDLLPTGATSTWAADDSDVLWVAGKPTCKWFDSFFAFVLESVADAAETLVSLADSVPLLPTRDGFVVPLSRGSGVVSARGSEALSEDALAALGVLGTRVAVASLPSSKLLDAYTHAPTQAGLLAAIDAGLRRRGGEAATLTADQAAALRAALAKKDSAAPLRPELLATAAKLALWPTYAGGLVALNGATRHILAGFVPSEDEASLLDEAFLRLDGGSAEATLAIALGAAPLDRAQFVLGHVLPRLEKMAQASQRERLVLGVLRDLATLEDEAGNSMKHETNARLTRALSQLAFVPTASSSSSSEEEATVYKRADELVDPSSRAASGAPLALLLPPAHFPSYALATHAAALAGLRLLGLQTQLDWRGVLAAAESVDADPTNLEAAQRGAALVRALDADAAQLFDDVEPAAEPSSPGVKAFGWGFFKGVVDTLGGSAASRQSAADREARLALKKRLRAQVVAKLYDLAWLPISTSHDSLGDADGVLPLTAALDGDAAVLVAAPKRTRPWDAAWACSGSFFILDAGKCEAPRSPQLLRALHWGEAVSVGTIATQLRLVAEKYQRAADDDDALEAEGAFVDTDALEASATSPASDVVDVDAVDAVDAVPPPRVASAVRRRQQAMVRIVPRLYAALDAAICGGGRVSALAAISSAIGEETPCVWVARSAGFVCAASVALRGVPTFTNDADAAPFMHALPADLACFEAVMRALGVRETFCASDYVDVCRKLETPLSSKQLQLALALVHALGADSTLSAERCSDMGVLAPDESGLEMRAAADLVYDDAPWLRSSGDLGFVAIHADVSAKTALKLGVRSLRRVLLDRGAFNDSARDDAVFGDGVEALSFGQNEPITRRLRHILELYPEGAGVVSELVQNADDAGATRVRITLDARSKRGETSLLSPGLAEWQGPCLCVYNDAQFDADDWRNLVRVGQASKLEKPETTGRFGLGFNSVYHYTDVPQLLSGEHVLFLDPHADGLVPGATAAQPGLRVRFTNGARLRTAFPDQFEPWAALGCDLGDEPFQGTLFRLPLRSARAAARSDISKQSYDAASALELLQHFRGIADDVLLFLRNVALVEVCVLDDLAKEPRLLFSARAQERAFEARAPSAFERPISLRTRREGDAVAAFEASCPSKAAFYAKLRETPEAQLPWSTRSLTVIVQDGEARRIDDYVVVTVIGGGAARNVACAAELSSKLKLVPIGSVAWLRSTHAGDAAHGVVVDAKDHVCHAFCFLPLPAKTGLPLDVNGHFELSSNRRDVWYGDDMAGDGRRRSEWNTHLLQDVVAMAYARLLRVVADGEDVLKLMPTRDVAAPWNACRAAVFAHVSNMPVLRSKLDESLVSPAEAVAVCAGRDDAIARLLLLEALPVVSLPAELHAAMVEARCVGAECTPHFVRQLYAKLGAYCDLENAGRAVRLRRKSLRGARDVEAALAYACADEADAGSTCHVELATVPLLLLESGDVVTFGGEGEAYFVADDAATARVLRGLCPRRVAHESVSRLVSNVARARTTRLRIATAADVCALIELRISQGDGVDSHRVVEEGLLNDSTWLAALWQWVAQATAGGGNEARAVAGFVAARCLLPCLVKGHKALVRLDAKTPLVSPLLMLTGSSFGQKQLRDDVIAALLASGVAVLDVATLLTASSEVGGAEGARTLAPCVLDRCAQPTLVGVLSALRDVGENFDDVDSDSEAAPADESNEDAAAVLRQWILNECSLSGLDAVPDEAKTLLRAVAIFKTVGGGHASVVSGARLPPKGADAELCVVVPRKVRLLDAADAVSATLLDLVKAPRIDRREFVLAALGAMDVAGAPGALLREVAVGSEALLSDAVFAATLAEAAFVPTKSGVALRPRDLYDPSEAGLDVLLDGAQFPETRDDSALRVLRKLGLRRALDRAGVVASAKSTQLLADKALLADKTSSGAERGARLDSPTEREGLLEAAARRGGALLRMLDASIETLLSVDTDDEPDPEDDLEDGSEDEDDGSGPVKRGPYSSAAEAWLSELRSLRWVPVAAEPPADFAALPWRRERICAPANARPEADAYVCSASLGVVSRADEPRSDALLRALGWDGRVAASVAASQLVALSNAESEGLSRLLPTALAKIYDVLADAHRAAKPPAAADDDEVDDFEVDETAASSLRAAKELLAHERWIWLGAGDFATARSVAFSAPPELAPYLHACPRHLAESHGALFDALGVRSTFDQNDFAEASRQLFHAAAQPLGDGDLALSLRLVSCAADAIRSARDAPACTVYVPDAQRRLHEAADLAFDDAAWLGPAARGALKLCDAAIPHRDARAVGVKSVRALLLTNDEAMQAIPCVAAAALNGDDSDASIESALSEIVSAFEPFACAAASLVVDERLHGASSLLHPSLVAAQGPALVLFFRGEPLRTDDIVRLLSPIAATAAAAVAAGQSPGEPLARGSDDARPPVPRRALGAAFALTDCLLVLAGDQLHVFDPCGSYLVQLADEDAPTQEAEAETAPIMDEEGPSPAQEDLPERQHAAPQGRRYSLAGDVVRRFPDQFEPFLTLPFGVSEHGCASGTIVRIPLRRNASALGAAVLPADGADDAGATAADRAVAAFEESAQTCLVFATTLSSITTHRFASRPVTEGATAPRASLVPRLAIVRRDIAVHEAQHGVVGADEHDGRSVVRNWKKTRLLWRTKASKFHQLLFGAPIPQTRLNWRAPSVLYEFEIMTTSFEADDAAASKVDTWLCYATLAPSTALRDLCDQEAARPALGLRRKLGGPAAVEAPVISVAAHVRRANVDDRRSGAAQHGAAGSESRAARGAGRAFSLGVVVGDVSEALNHWNVDAPFVVAPAVAPVAGATAPEAAMSEAGDSEAGNSEAGEDEGDDGQEDVPSTALAVATAPAVAARTAFEPNAWNNALWTAVFVDVVPAALLALRERLGERHALYRFWPRLGDEAALSLVEAWCGPGNGVAAMASNVLVQLPLYLASNNLEWLRASDGIFRAEALPLRVEAFVARRLALLHVPAAVSAALGDRIRTLTPATLRSLLKSEDAAKLAKEVERDGGANRLATQLLRLCARDALQAAGDDAAARTLRQACWTALRPLPLFALASGGVAAADGAVRIVLATRAQQALCCPDARGAMRRGGPQFIAPRLLETLPDLLAPGGSLTQEFATALRFERFNVATLAAELRHILPPSWRGAAEVPWPPPPWSPGEAPAPTAAWLRRFWGEVDLCDAATVSLFDEWPLIPTRRGALVSCSRRESVIGLRCPERPSPGDDAADRAREAAIDRDDARREAQEDDIDRQRFEQMGETGASWILGRGAAIDAPAEAPAPDAPDDAAPLLEAPQLLALLDVLRAPLLDEDWWPAGPKRAAVVRSLGGGTPRRRALGCLAATELQSRGEAGPRLEWSKLTAVQEADLLLQLVSPDSPAAQPSSLAASQVEKLRVLPLYVALSGERVALDAIPNVAMLAEDVRALLPIAAPGDAGDVLTAPQDRRLADLYVDVGVRRMDEAEAFARLVLPQFELGLSADVATRVSTKIAERWDAAQHFRGSRMLADALKTTAFVPCGVVVEGRRPLRRADELLDPTSRAVTDVAIDDGEDDDCLYPGLDCRTEKWLKLLGDVGLRRTLGGAAFVVSARRAALRRDPNLSRRLLRLLAANADIGADARHVKQIGSINFVPVLDYSGVCDSGGAVEAFGALRDAVAPRDAPLCWTAAYVLRVGDCPPLLLWSALGIQSPPKVETVLAHVRVLSRHPRAALAAMDLSPVEAFRPLYDYLDGVWSSLSPAVRAALPRLPLVPVGDVTSAEACTLVAADSRRVFVEIEGGVDADRLAPLVYELARPLQAHAPFLSSKLGLARSPTSAEYAALLRKLANGDAALDPNELLAALQLVELGAPAAGGAAVVPDVHGRLLRAADCVFVDGDDDEALLRRCGASVNVAHRRLPKATLLALGVRPLAAVAREVLTATVPLANDAAMFEPTAEEMTVVLRSSECADALARLALGRASNRAEASLETLRAEVVAGLSGLTVEFVEAIETGVSLAGASTAAAPRRALAYVDAPSRRLIVAAAALPRHVLSPADAAAPALLRHLRQPEALALPLAALLASPPAGVAETLALLQLSDAGDAAAGDDRGRESLLRGTPGAPVAESDAGRLRLAPRRAFVRNEIVAVQGNGGLRYAVVQERLADRDGARCARLQVGGGREDTAEMLSTAVFVFQRDAVAAEASPEAESAERPAVEPPRDAASPTEAASAGAAPARPAAQATAQASVLRAVDDLLRHARLPPLETDRARLLAQLAEARRAAAAAAAEADAARAEANDALALRGLDAAEPPSEFLCSITREVMVDPVVAADGHTYERVSIERWVRTRRSSPQTNAPLSSREVVPNHALKSLIRTWTETHPGGGP
ncbi:hypothetical protein M885DRAFT_610341 [Pelagophyceae sp. CCMP2097]|nr:hypothetical protein M885DRAFT_610341 [Pelagophyceae sp. CCMP2097]